MNYYEVKVKTYENAKEFDRDAKRMSKGGWQVVQVTNQQPRPGILWQDCSIGDTGVFKPKPVLVVTYQRL